MGLRLIGIAAGLVGGRAQEIGAAGDEPEADALGLQGFLGMGGTDGQQQPAKQQEHEFRFSSVNFAATISTSFSKPFIMDHI